MDISEVFSLAKQGEGQYLEFKLKSNHPEKISKEAVAFANTSGGYLLIGVDDNKEVKGLKFPHEDLFVLEKAFESLIDPPINYSYEIVYLKNEKGILVFEIPKSELAPHFLLENGNRNVYVRSKDQSIRASREMIEILKNSKKQKQYRFSIQEKEKKLLEYIDKYGEIGINDFMKIANINRKAASRTLVLLSLTNVLEIVPKEVEDKFRIKSN